LNDAPSKNSGQEGWYGGSGMARLLCVKLVLRPSEKK